MTVIAYSAKHGVIASDSRCTSSSGMHLTNCKKIFRLKNGAIVGTAGDSDDREIRVLLEKSTPRKLPSRAAVAELKTNFGGLLVFPKGQVFLVAAGFDNGLGGWYGSIEPITDDFAASGSGQEFAYGAMEAGKSPIEAVRIACRRDTHCALPVQWEKVAP